MESGSDPVLIDSEVGNSCSVVGVDSVQVFDGIASSFTTQTRVLSSDFNLSSFLKILSIKLELFSRLCLFFLLSAFLLTGFAGKLLLCFLVLLLFIFEIQEIFSEVDRLRFPLVSPTGSSSSSQFSKGSISRSKSLIYRTFFGV